MGTFLSETADAITFIDIETSRKRTVQKRKTIRIDKPITVDDASRAVGLATVAAWKVGLMDGREKPVGKIAQLTSQVVYVTLGKEDRIREGHVLEVYRTKGEVKDPDTGHVLTNLRPKISKLVVTEVHKQFSKAKFVGDLEVSLLVGDEVEPEEFGLKVAVCPLPNEDGTLTDIGVKLAEDMTTGLVQRNVTVVERSVLKAVLGELIGQQSILFDSQTAQKLGRLTGANAVMTGKIVPDRNLGKAYVRLIDVATGEILFAASDTLNLKSAKVVGTLHTHANSKLPSQQQPSSIGKNFVNSVGMKFVPIPAGEFFMGSLQSDEYAKEEEFPRRKVKISKSFYMAAFEVTGEHYIRVMGGGPLRQGTEQNVSGNKSWIDAFDFCQQLSELPAEKRAGRKYRLPTEAEWEYACRAGSTTKYFFGDDTTRSEEYVFTGWPTTQVGTKKPNAWGLYDMQGNCTEWCSDWYSPDAYKTQPDVDPKGPETGRVRVHRGASSSSRASDFRSAARWQFRPDERYVTLGIRVVCETR